MKLNEQLCSDQFGRIGLLLSLANVMEITGKSRSTVLRWSQDSVYGFPNKVRIGPNSIAWKRDDILEWIESLPSRGVTWAP